VKDGRESHPLHGQSRHRHSQGWQALGEIIHIVRRISSSSRSPALAEDGVQRTAPDQPARPSPSPGKKSLLGTTMSS